MDKLSREELLLTLAIVFKDAGEDSQEKDLFDRAYRQIDSLLRKDDKTNKQQPLNAKS